MSRKNRQNLPAQRNSQNVTATHQKVAVTAYMGPIPTASEMLRYEEACPGLPDRIMAMAEQQSKHRQEVERIAIKASSRNSTLGVIFAFILAVSTLAAGVYCIKIGEKILGTSIGGLGLASIVGAFIHGTRSNRAERKEKYLASRNK